MHFSYEILSLAVYLEVIKAKSNREAFASWVLGEQRVKLSSFFLVVCDHFLIPNYFLNNFFSLLFDFPFFVVCL
jgi:hypothetical protein